MMLPVHLDLVIIATLVSVLLVEHLKDTHGLNTLINIDMVVILKSLEEHYQHHGKRLFILANSIVILTSDRFSCYKNLGIQLGILFGILDILVHIQVLLQ